jgi:hypothetical protein
MTSPSPTFDPTEVLPWVGAAASPSDSRTHAEIAAELAEERRKGLSPWSIGEPDLAAFYHSTSLNAITPGA